MTDIKQIVDRYMDLGYNVFEVKSMLFHEIEQALDEIIQNNYIIIRFDSPNGADSKTETEALLDKKPAQVKWVGHLGTRGETTVMIASKDFDVTPFISDLRKAGILDNYSKITITM